MLAMIKAQFPVDSSDSDEEGKVESEGKPLHSIKSPITPYNEKPKGSEDQTETI